MNKLTTACVIGVAAVALTACTSANTVSGEKALHYSGGALSSQKFENCVEPNTLDWDGPGDFHYYYPIGTRDFKFSTDEGSDFPPLTTSTKGIGDQPGIELTVKGQVKFSITGDCKKLQEFHEKMGAQKEVPGKDKNGEGDGWKKFLGTNIKDVVDRAIDMEALNFTYTELYNDSGKRAQWEKAVKESTVPIVKELLGGDYFTVDTVLLQKPDLPDNVKNQLIEGEAARIRQTNANIDIATAEKFGGMDNYTKYLGEVAVSKAIAEGRIAPAAVPYGSPIIVAPK